MLKTSKDIDRSVLMQLETDFSPSSRKFIETKFGKTAYVEQGEGFPTVFLHGLGQSAYFWRNQLRFFLNERRCIAPDLMAHGYTHIRKGCDVSFRAQAEMLLSFLDGLGIDRFDLVMNDSGGAIGQLMAVRASERVRSMVFSNCDVHDNWPPKTLSEIRESARAGLYADQIAEFVLKPTLFWQTTGPLVYEDPQFATPEAIEMAIAPIIASRERKNAFNQYVGMQDTMQLVEIEHKLRALEIPSLIVWGTADPFFPIEWAYWLEGALPLASDVIEIKDAKLFFPEERATEFNQLIEPFWSRLN